MYVVRVARLMAPARQALGHWGGACRKTWRENEPLGRGVQREGGLWPPSFGLLSRNQETPHLLAPIYPSCVTISNRDTKVPSESKTDVQRS